MAIFGRWAQLVLPSELVSQRLPSPLGPQARHMEVLSAPSNWDSVASRPPTKDQYVRKTFGQYIMKTRSTPPSCQFEYRSSTGFPRSLIWAEHARRVQPAKIARETQTCTLAHRHTIWLSVVARDFFLAQGLCTPLNYNTKMAPQVPRRSNMW